MAVIMVRERFIGRGGDLALAGKNRATRVFKLKTNSAYDNEATIFASGLLPTFGSAHPSNPKLFARAFRAKQVDDSAFMWEVEVEYDDNPNTLPQLSKEIQPNPLLRKVTIEGKSVHRRIPMRQAPFVATATISAWNDGAGRSIPIMKSPVQTSSQEPIEHAEMDDDQFVWHITWNVPSIPFWVADYQNSVNAGPVLIRGITIPARKLKLGGFIHSDKLIEQVMPYVYVEYFKVNFDLNYSREGWFQGYRDEGYMKLVSGAQKEILLADDSKPSRPVPLDGSGAVLSSPTISTILYNWYAPYPEKDFSVFPLNS